MVNVNLVNKLNVQIVLLVNWEDRGVYEGEMLWYKKDFEN